MYVDLPHRNDGFFMTHDIFDKYAHKYDQELKKSIRFSGESTAFFHEYKIIEVYKESVARGIHVGKILDFGSGVGNSLEFWQKWFPSSEIVCADTSPQSLKVSRSRAYKQATHVRISQTEIPCDTDEFDIVFAACVFHHISHDNHVHWLTELRRVTAPNGILIIFEHNPLNPLTVSAVRNCPYDADAKLVYSHSFIKRIRSSGWSTPSVRFRLFFPKFLSFLRPLERLLSKVPLGAQFFIVATALKSPRIPDSD